MWRPSATKLNDVETKIGDNTPLLLFDNHDNPRLQARYGDGVHDLEIQRALAAVLFLSRGAAQFYYGDEMGMMTTPPTRKEDVKDPIGITGWPLEKGRDGERTPMQWDASANAGFSNACSVAACTAQRGDNQCGRGEPRCATHCWPGMRMLSA